MNIVISFLESSNQISTDQPKRYGSVARKILYAALFALGSVAGAAAGGALFSFTAAPLIISSFVGAATIGALVGLALLCKAIAHRFFASKADDLPKPKPLSSYEEAANSKEIFMQQLRKAAEAEAIPSKQPITEEDRDKAYSLIALLQGVEALFGTQGIGRLSPNPSEVATLEQQIQNESVENPSIHALMKLLKSHYKKMNLLGGPELTKQLLAIGEMGEDQKGEAIQQMKTLLEGLTKQERILLMGFVDIYQQIWIAQRNSSLPEKEQMGLNALAKMAYPNLLSLTGAQEGAYQSALTKAAELLIEHVEELFPMN